MLSLPETPVWRIGGLNGGEDGDDEDWVVISDISDIKSGVDGAQERRADDMLEVLATLRSPGDSQDLFESGIRDPSRDVATGELLWNEGEDDEDGRSLCVIGDEGDCRKNRFFISSIASIEGRPEERLKLVSGVPKRWRMVLLGVVRCSPVSGLLLRQKSVCGDLLPSRADIGDPSGEDV